MAKHLKIISILLIMGNLPHTAFAASKEKKIIESNFPSSLSNMKSVEGSILTLENGKLDYIWKSGDLDGNSKERFLVVLYRARTGPAAISCELDVIKITHDTGTAMGKTVLNASNDLYNCNALNLNDLDGDHKPEILVTTFDSRGYDLPAAIFRWDGNKLVEITPTTTLNNNVVTAFRSLRVTDVHINKSVLLIDLPDSSMDDNPSTITYLMQNDKINLTGTFDFFYLIEKDGTNKFPLITLNPATTFAGLYTLTVKNASDHNRAVRAEITVNSNVVLKPQDFCSSPQPSKSDKDKWKGNDDDDDKDEDHCKHCVPKQEVNAVVNLNATNTIKVKVYGKQDSKLELILVKKP